VYQVDAFGIFCAESERLNPNPENVDQGFNDSPETSRNSVHIPQQGDREDAPLSIVYAGLPPAHSNRENISEPRVSEHLESRYEPHVPSSQKLLTRPLGIAREAVQLDSANEEPRAAVTLHSEIIEQVQMIFPPSMSFRSGINEPPGPYVTHPALRMCLCLFIVLVRSD
jgi:hypothetical protein